MSELLVTENLDFPTNNEKFSSDNEAVLEHLKIVLVSYLESRPHLTLNGLSKRCAVSEPTLRRIRKGQVKTIPSMTTIFELLSYLSGETQAKKIMACYPGPLQEYLKLKAPAIEDFQKIEYSEFLSVALKDPVKYVIYKLAAGSQGLSFDKVVELFGTYGERQLLALIAEQLIYEKQNLYYAKIESFALSHDVFVEHFKTMADFIKPHKHANANKFYSPIFSNYSGSINKQAYSEILKVQRKTTKKIAKILNSPKSMGSIPTFIINAVDTIDSRCADEFPDDNSPAAKGAIKAPL